MQIPVKMDIRLEISHKENGCKDKWQFLMPLESQMLALIRDLPGN